MCVRLCMFGYITHPDNMSLSAVSPAVSEQVRPVVTLPESAGLQIKAPDVQTSPLNTSGVLARGRTHDMLWFLEQAGCFLLQGRGMITRMEQPCLKVCFCLLRLWEILTCAIMLFLFDEFKGLDYVLNWLCNEKWDYCMMKW